MRPVPMPAPSGGDRAAPRACIWKSDSGFVIIHPIGQFSRKLDVENTWGVLRRLKGWRLGIDALDIRRILLKRGPSVMVRKGSSCERGESLLNGRRLPRPQSYSAVFPRAHCPPLTVASLILLSIHVVRGVRRRVALLAEVLRDESSIAFTDCANSRCSITDKAN